MAKLIFPKNYVDKIDVPLIFLAGPIRGAPNWQDEAIRFLMSKNTDIAIASPRREINPEFAEYVASGRDDYFPRQRAWERHYLDVASKTGARLFWLPGEVNHKCSKSYGLITAVEFGQSTTAYKYDKSVRFCVGTDGRFNEISTFLYDLERDAPDKIVYNTLEETCLEALRLVNEKSA